MSESNPFNVPNIIPIDKTKIEYIFILESPHTTEVCCNIPLVGKSGEVIYKTLEIKNDRYKSFGMYVKYERNDTVILNTSTFPLQLTGIPQADAYYFYKKEKIDSFRNAGDNLKPTNEKYAEIFTKCQDNLQQGFKQSGIEQSKAKVIVCGKIAKAVLQNIIDTNDNLISKENIIECPHPASPFWYKKLKEDSEFIAIIE